MGLKLAYYLNFRSTLNDAAVALPGRLKNITAVPFKVASLNKELVNRKLTSHQFEEPFHQATNV